jgi:hypothetical protein
MWCYSHSDLDVSFPDGLVVRDVPRSLLEMMEELCVVRRAPALYQLTPLVRPVHTNSYAYMIHAHEQGVVTLSDIPAAPSCHVITDAVLSEAPLHEHLPKRPILEPTHQEIRHSHLLFYQSSLSAWSNIPDQTLEA